MFNKSNYTIFNSRDTELNVSSQLFRPCQTKIQYLHIKNNSNNSHHQPHHPIDHWNIIFKYRYIILHITNQQQNIEGHNTSTTSKNGLQQTKIQLNW